MLSVDDLHLPASKKITDDKIKWEASQNVYDDLWDAAQDLVVGAALAAFAGYNTLNPIAYALLPDEAAKVLRLVIA